MGKIEFLEKDISAIESDLHITCLDIGARGGVIGDLRSLGKLINAIGFEPDPAECELLNNKVENNKIWRSLRYIPAALGAGGKGVLNLYRQRGCSSLLQADELLASQFQREGYYQLDDQVGLETIQLDKAAEKYDFEDASYIKIDIQGGELDVFKSGDRLLKDEIFAIRTEVSFLPIYKGQPLIWDIAHYLAGKGFVPVEFPEIHEWRRMTKIKLPRLSKGSLPYSRGQLVHGDVLFFKDPSLLLSDSDLSIKRCIKGALIATAYGYIDYAYVLLSKKNVSEYMRERYGIEVDNFLSGVSRRAAKNYRLTLLIDCIRKTLKAWKMK